MSESAAAPTVYYEDITKVCRGCLGKSGAMRPLFGSCLDTMLMAVAEVQVYHGDGLPELMCVQCVLQVSRAFTFKKQCQRSDLSLRNFLRSCEHVEETPVKPESLAEDVEANVIGSGQTVEVEFEDPRNGEKCLLIVQHIPGTIEEIEPNRDFHESGQIVENIMVDECDLEISNQNADSSDLNHSNHTIIIDPSDDFAADDLMSNQFDSFSNDEIVEDVSLFEADEQKVQFTCLLCGAPADSLDELKEHEAQQHHSLPEKRFECNVCHKVFSENKVLKRHLKIHCDIKPHVCSTCNMSFAESSNLTKHKKKHTGELRNVVGKPNLCTVCGKRFKWASSLSKHMKHHTKHKILNCPHCPKYYVEARSLNIHIRSHTGEKPFVCEICKKGFTQMGNLEKHIRVHTGEKPFLCPVCGKGFSQSGYVAIHVRTHTGERPYKCGDCGKRFAGSNTLAIHKRTHTGERPYPCGICEKSFARQETAIIHQRTHTGEKPHICKVCHRGFSSSGHLSGHLRSHQGIKPHECTICKKRFAGGTSLKSHMKSNHSDNLEEIASFVCLLCNQSYSSLKLLQKHEIVEHALSAIATDDDLDELKSDQILMTDEIIVNADDLIVVEQV